MALENLDALITAMEDVLQGQLDGEDFSRHVALAEGDVFPILKHYKMEKRVALTTVGGAITFPADMQEAISILVDGKVALLVPSNGPVYLRAGEIGFYQIGDQYVFVPEQAAPRAVVLTYFARPIPLSTVAPTNWLLTKFPAVYFHAALARGYRYRGGDALALEQAEKASLQEALMAVATDHKRVTQSGNSIISIGGAGFGD
ncbi:hypothetical protein [Rhizobium sp. Leaf262]|uniref:phage adaptor protein n=1 Tax=Rhizobium sp. Leaf262 TaxID=1736312 RepID=UPI000713DF44|nr:hypothetical protein [Rhizobium sp. Leaf262]KQO79438.1 hypothetical protein ASF29_23295 [Rhizobium sp. Leaf262]